MDKLRRRVAVTHKKTLVRSELAVVATWRTRKVGRGAGVVTGVEPYGVFVQLFGEARGLAGLQDLGLSVIKRRKRRTSRGGWVSPAPTT